jgi:hypothetical protein
MFNRIVPKRNPTGSTVVKPVERRAMITQDNIAEKFEAGRVDDRFLPMEESFVQNLCKADLNKKTSIVVPGIFVTFNRTSPSFSSDAYTFSRPKKKAKREDLSFGEIL